MTSTHTSRGTGQAKSRSHSAYQCNILGMSCSTPCGEEHIKNWTGRSFSKRLLYRRRMRVCATVWLEESGIPPAGTAAVYNVFGNSSRPPRTGTQADTETRNRRRWTAGHISNFSHWVKLMTRCFRHDFDYNISISMIGVRAELGGSSSVSLHRRHRCRGKNTWDREVSQPTIT